MTARHRAPRPASWPRRLLTTALMLTAAVSMMIAFAPEVAPATTATEGQAGPTLAVVPRRPTAGAWTTAPVTTTPVVAPEVVVQLPLPTTTPPAVTTTVPPAPVTTSAPPTVTSPSASQPKPAPATGTACPATGFAGVKAHVARVGWHVVGRFGLDPDLVYGVAGRAGVSDHPLGLALDFMASSKELGDGIADYVLERRSLFGVTYVIWRQRINFGSGWEPMEDRGGVTANHYDHVHVSFATAGSNGLITC